jgi:hypothetical protein
LQESDVIVIVGEDGSSVVAAVEGVIDETISDGAGQASHGPRLERGGREGVNKED